MKLIKNYQNTISQAKKHVCGRREACRDGLPHSCFERGQEIKKTIFCKISPNLFSPCA